MIVIDLNLLLYAYDDLSPDHAPAKQWWINLLAGPELVGLCDLVVVNPLH
jgi:predicted nucleic acid-binding protein